VSEHRFPRFTTWLAVIVILLSMLLQPLSPLPLYAEDTPDPTSVTIAGSLQTELGCSGDWQPECSATYLSYDAGDDAWQGVFAVPAGNWEYKAALNGSWAENYGLNATRDGANIPLTLGVAADVKFYYDHKSHWITDNQYSTIATVPGELPKRARLPGRLGSELSPLLVAGPRRRRRVQLFHHGHPRGRL